MIAEARLLDPEIYTLPTTIHKTKDIVRIEQNKRLLPEEKAALGTYAEKLHRLGRDSEMVKRAIYCAGQAHAGQKRKISGEPYIYHVIEVADLSDPYVPQEGIAAGLLHDGPEDTEYTLQMIREDFGDKVWSIVDDLTEQHFAQRVSQDAPEEVKKKDWRRRKEKQIARIPSMQNVSRIILTANTIANIASMKREYIIFGDEMFSQLTVGKTLQLSRYFAETDALGNFEETNPLYDQHLKEFGGLIDLWSSPQ